MTAPGGDIQARRADAVVSDAAPPGDLAGQLERVAAPLREQVSELLRKEIAERRLLPAQRLVERELIERIGVSRTTIREALRELASEGLITMVPQKGAIVAAPSWEEAAEVYDVRGLLEGAAARRFAEHASDAYVAALGASLLAIERCVEADDAAGMLAEKDRFYDVLFEGAGNAIMRQVIEGLRARVAVLRAASLEAPDRPKQSLKEIRAIAEAIAERNPEAAARAASFHVSQAAETLFTQIGGRPARERKHVNG